MEILKFGPFQLIVGQRLLLNGGVPLRLGSRALDILIALTAKAGEVVSKDELIAAAWPDTFVEEVNLRVHIGALRKALGDDDGAARFISNVPGRGYCFIATLTVETPVDVANHSAVSADLPHAFDRMVGRDAALQLLIEKLVAHRLTTVVGTGGIGKTTLAVAAAHASRTQYRDGVIYVDLTAAQDRLQVFSNIASVMGRPGRSDDVLADILQPLETQQFLMVLDGCEHVLSAVVEFVEAVLGRTERVVIIATSREPLRVPGESVFRLGPLDVPPEGVPLTAVDCLRYSSVQLFVDRASSVLGGYTFSDQDAEVIADICRRVDGIALAIELAAGRVDSIGIRGLAKALDRRFEILTRTEDTAKHRHQTLRAMLDWSYLVLSERDRLAFRYLSVFIGEFTLDAARQVIPDVAALNDTRDRLNSLVSKSIVIVDVGGTEVHYRLLDTTRLYGLEKLDEHAERGDAARRHAEYYRDFFQRSYAEWETGLSEEWFDHYGSQIGNLRVACAWAFSDEHNVPLGIALTVAAIPLLFRLSHLDECLELVTVALAAAKEENDFALNQRMRLHAVLGYPHMHGVKGVANDNGAGGGVRAWRKVLELAEQLGDADYMLRSLWALWVDRTNCAQPHEALELAQRFKDVARRQGDAMDVVVSDRLLGATFHLLGDQPQARINIEQMLSRYRPPVERSHIVRFQYDQKVLARLMLARVYWVQGLPDSALREINAAIVQAETVGHTLSYVTILAEGACSIALMAGEYRLAARFIEDLERRTRTRALDVWNIYAQCFEGQRLIHEGDPKGGLAVLRPALEKLEHSGFVAFRSCFLLSLVQGLALTGQASRALALVTQALVDSERSGEGWVRPEYYRLRGELILDVDQGESCEVAERDFRRALTLAAEQSALAWEVRAAVSLAELLVGQARRSEALDLLVPVLNRLTEGHGSDVVRRGTELAASLARNRA